MKNIYSLLSILPLLLMGCSSTYTINDFPSKEKFYEDFNNSVKNKDIKVVKSNDSSFSLMQGAVLENDTLFAFGKSEEKKYMRLALSDIEKLNYTNNDYKSAYVLRKNGEELNCENIIINHDSIYFDMTKTVLIEENIAPLNKVKIISYKNRWRKIPTGILSGALIGLASGLLYSSSLQDSKDDAGLASGAGISGAFIGALIGGIISYFIGYNYYYQFNP